jgi:hypothetical protein
MLPSKVTVVFLFPLLSINTELCPYFVNTDELEGDQFETGLLATRTFR